MAPVPSVIDGLGYQLDFEDNFTSLSPIWQPHPWYRNAIEPGAVTVSDGTLKLQSFVVNNYRYSSIGTLGPRATSGPPWYPQALHWNQGYFEARLRYSNDASTYAAFWMLSFEHSDLWETGAHWTPDACPTLKAEWDILEAGLGEPPNPDSVTWSVLHRNNLDGVCGAAAERVYVSRSGSGFSGWHTWSGLWTPNSVRMFLDGEPAGQLPTYDTTNQSMYLIFQSGVKGLDQGITPALDTYETEVDWVRVWTKSGDIPMVYPEVVATASSAGPASAVTSHPVNLPTGIEADDLLVVIAVINTNATLTFPAGWTVLGNTGSTVGGVAAEVRMYVAYREADGSEGSTITLTSNAARRSCSHAYRITGHVGLLEWAFTHGTSTTPDPPNLDPGFDDEEILWIACFGNDDPVNTSATPSGGYTAIAHIDSTGAGGSACGVGSAWRQNTAATEDPAAWTISASQEWASATIAVHPRAADVVLGSASGSFGASATAVGQKRKVGSSAGNYGFTATLAGFKRRLATAVGSYGSSRTAAGFKRKLATAAGTFGTARTVAGLKRKSGLAAGTYATTRTAVGSRRKLGTSGGSIGFAGTLSGLRRRLGTLLSSFGFSAHGAGYVDPGLVGGGQIEPVFETTGRVEPIIDYDSDLSFILGDPTSPVTESTGRTGAVIEAPGRVSAVVDSSATDSVTDSPGRVAVTTPSPRYTARED